MSISLITSNSVAGTIDVNAFTGSITAVAGDVIEVVLHYRDVSSVVFNPPTWNGQTFTEIAPRKQGPGFYHHRLAIRVTTGGTFPITGSTVGGVYTVLNWGYAVWRSSTVNFTTMPFRSYIENIYNTGTFAAPNIAQGLLTNEVLSSALLTPNWDTGFGTGTSTFTVAGANTLISSAASSYVTNVKLLYTAYATGTGAVNSMFAEVGTQHPMYVHTSAILFEGTAPHASPTPFTFTAVPASLPATVNTSNSITVAGIDGGALLTAISITGGTYSINGGAYTAAAGTTKLGDVITVQTTSSAAFTTAVSATLTIGGVSGTYTVTTLTGNYWGQQTLSGATTIAMTGQSSPRMVYGRTYTPVGNENIANIEAYLDNSSVSGSSGFIVGIFDVTAGRATASLVYSNTITLPSSGPANWYNVASSFTLLAGKTYAYAFVGTGNFSTVYYRQQTASMVESDSGVTNYTMPSTWTGTVGASTLDMLLRITTTSTANTTPSPFTFTAATNATPSATVTSNSITVAGMDGGATTTAISITGGTYSINGGAYTATTGTTKLGDVITVRVNASASYSTAVSTTLTIGGVSGTFTATTRAAITTPTAFSFTTASGVNTNTVTTSNAVSVLGVDSGQAISISISGGTYSVNGGAYTASAGTVQLNDSVTVRVTSSASYQTGASGTLTIGGVTGTFTVNTRAPITTPSAFSFTAQTGSTPAATITSNAVSVLGIDAGQNIAISITGGTYSINGGAYTASAGTTTLNDSITVRVNASASYSTLVSATLTINGVTGTFNDTTRAAITTPTAFSFTATTNAVLSSTQTSNSITVLGIDGGAITTPISIVGGTYSINGGAYSAVTGTTKLNDVITVRVVASSSANTGTSGTLTIGGVSGTYNVSTGTPVLVPSAFTLTAATGVGVGTTQTSNSFTVSGITSGYNISISITGGTYSVNGGAYTASAGTVTLNDVVTVRVVASGSYSTLATATVNVNGTSGTYNVTTRAAITAPTAFTFTTVSGVNTATATASNSITVLGVDSGVAIPISITGGTYSVNGGAYTASAGTVQLNDSVVVKVTSSTSYQTGASGTLTIGGITGTFAVNTRAAITTPTAFSFTAQTGLNQSTLITSSAVTVAGVDAAVPIAWSVTGGTASVNGGTAAASGTAVLGDSIVVKVTTSASYSTLVSATLTLGGVSATFNATTKAQTASLVSINAGTVLAESSGNTVVTTAYPTATGLTIGGVATVSFTGSANSYSFAVPVMANGGVYPAFGTVVAVITDGTTPSNLNVTFSPKATQGFVTLTSVGTGVGFIGNYVTAAVGDQVVFDLPAVHSVVSNGVRADGSIFSDYSGTQTMWHRNGTTGVLTQLNVVTPGVVVTTPTAFTFTPAVGAAFATVINSNAITVTGVTAATPIAISITGGGFYSKNGGAFVSTNDTVVLGDTVVVQKLSSAVGATLVSTTLTIGGVSATYNVTTRAYITAPTSFSLTDVTGANPSTAVQSNQITVLGIDTGITTAISITGGQYSINGGSFTASAGTVSLNDHVVVQVTSASGYTTLASATLTIGGVTGVFNVTTRAVDTIPNAFTFTTVTGAAVNTAITSNAVTISGVDAATNIPVSITGGTYSINGGAFTATAGNMRLGDTVAVQLTSSSSNNTSTSATVTIGTVTGTFSVSTGVAVTIPTAFSFAAVNGANVSTATDSAPFTVAGTTPGVNVPISITGGLYAVDSGSGYGAFTAVSGNVQLGWNVKVRMSSSAAYSAAASATLTVGGISATFTVNTRAVIVAPTAFTLSAVTNAALSTTVTSNAVSVLGVDAGQNIPISITGGLYSVNGGNYTAVAGTCLRNDSVTVRVTSSALNSTATSATLTIGGVSATYTVTTVAFVPITVPTVFSFTAQTSVNPNTVTTSSAITVLGITAATPVAISIVGGTYSINGGTYTAVTGTTVLGDVITIRLTSSSSYATAASATLTIGGVAGVFTATTRARRITPTLPTTVAAALFVYESAPIAITGVDGSVDIAYTVTGGDVAVDSGSGFGAYSNAGGNVQLGYNIKLRLTQTASQAAAGVGVVTVVVGGVSLTYTAGGTSGGGVVSLTPAPFTFTNVSAVPLSSVINSDVVNISGVTDGVNVPVSVTGGSWSFIRGSVQSAFTTAVGTVKLADRIQLQVATGTASGGTETVSVTVGTYTTSWTVANQLSVNIVPNPIAFTPVTGAVLNTPVTSSAAIITGVDAGIDIPITVTNAQYSVDSGSGFSVFTATPGVVRLGNKVVLRLTTSGTLGGVSNATVNVGTTIGNWSVANTNSANITPTPFVLVPVVSATGGQLYMSNAITVAGVDAGIAVPFTVTGAEWSVDSGSGFTVWSTGAGTVHLGNGLKLRLTASSAPGLTRSAVISFTGYDTRWTVTTLAAPTVAIVPTLTGNMASVNTSLVSASVTDAGLMSAQTL